MESNPQEDSVDVARLQLLFSTDHDPEVQIQASPVAPTRPPVTPARDPKDLLEVSPNTPLSNEHHTPTTSGDQTGSLRLVYSGPSYSQIDTGDTQVDSDSLQRRGLAGIFQVKSSQDDGHRATSRNTSPKTQDSVVVIGSGSTHSTPTKAPQGTTQGENDHENDLSQAEPEGPVYFPEDHRFDSPARRSTSTPAKPQDHNPLAGMFVGKNSAADFPSLTQLFSARSSPPRSVERPKTSSSMPPPTPGDATRIMARSFRGTESLHEVPRSPPNPSSTPKRSSSVPTTVPTQPLSTYRAAQEDEEEEGPQRRWRLSQSPHIARLRSISPVLFSSPGLPNGDEDILNSQDSFFSITSHNRRQAEARRKSGEEQVKELFQNASIQKNNRQTESASPRGKRKRPLKSTQRSSSKVARTEERPQTAVAAPPSSECGSPTQEDDEPEQKPTVAEDKGVQVEDELPQAAPFVPDVKPIDGDVDAIPQTYQTGPAILDEDWELMHGFQPARTPRKVRSVSALNGPQNKGAPKIQHTHTQPASEPDGSSPSNLPHERRKVSARQFPPFNLDVPRRPPTPTIPDFVRESSNLEPLSAPMAPPASSLTPVPSSSAETPIREVSRSSPPPVASNGEIVPKTPYTAQRISLDGMHNGDTTIPETSPWEREGMLTPTLKSKSTPDLATSDAACQRENGSPMKKRASIDSEPHPEGNGAVPCSVEEEANDLQTEQPLSQLRSFAALDDSTALFSSREEPEDIDMVAIVQSVGIGADPDLELPPPVDRPQLRKRKTLERATENSTKTVPVTEPDDGDRPSKRAKMGSAKAKAIISKVKDKLEKTAKSSISSTKTLARSVSRQQTSKPKTSTLRHVSSLADTPTPSMAAPIHDNEDCNSDILASNNPSFLISRSMDMPPIISPGRVFALFKDSKLHYHPATLISCESQTQVRVMFDDDTQDVLDRHCVRSLDLKVGDTVKVDLPNMKKHIWIVKSFPKAAILITREPVTPGPADETPEDEFTDIRGHSVLTVSAKNPAAASDGEIEVPLTKIYLIKSLWPQFDSRQPIPDSIPMALATHSTTPSVSISSAVTPSRSHRRSTPGFVGTLPVHTKTGLFGNMLFALTLGSKDGEKQKLTAKILANGGRIVEAGFEELFFNVDSPGPDDGSSRSSSREPSANPAGTDAGLLTPRPEAQSVGFACVLADRHSRRPKFLQALALGLPCLSYRWIDDCVRKGRILDWDVYLLPAGESKYLGDDVVKSRVLQPFDAETATFRDMIQSRKRLFDGLNVMIVTGKIGAIEKRKAYAFLTNALGATSIIKVKTLEAASKILQSPKGKWNTVIVGTTEKEKAVKMWKTKDIRVMDEEGVKENLILGRIEF